MGIKKSVQGQESPAVGAMAMKMKPLIMNLLLVLTVAMRMPLSLADPYTNIVSQYCGNEGQYENGSAFQRNLNELLERLVRDAYNNAFVFSSVADIGFNSAVYGLVQCTQDLGPYDRQRCASTAKTRLLQGCSGTYGYIQLSGCLLRYDKHYFYQESRERQGTSTTEVWSYCGKNQSRNDVPFQQSVNKVLESLVENANPTGFNTSNTVAKGATSNSAAVYGIVQCRGDLGSLACKQCASTAKEILVVKCYNTSGVIHLDGCFLRYGNSDTYNYVENMQITPTEVFCNSGTSSQPQQFQKTAQVLLSNIITEALRSPKLFAANSVGAPSNLTGHIYGLAQCWGHLSQANCRSCLTSALEYIFLCQNGAPGAQIARDRCHLRYEAFEFFNNSVLSWTPQGESPPLPESKNGSNISPRKDPPASTGKILGITLGVIAAVIGLTATIGLWMWYCSCRRKSRDQISGTKEILSPTIINSELIFKYDILREGTSNFKMENKLGEGGFGCVFKGVLPNGEEVAVKRLKVGSKQGEAEFLNETNLISRVQHRNLVKLLGCSVENSERLLVYEYLPIGSLDKLLFDTTKRHLLHWEERYKIIVGTARGLAYLHEESEIRIIHRDIKASNILLDHKHAPKIADFGLARLFAEDQSHVSTRVAGTIGYMAPEYALRGQLTEKADVFSFGVLLLEIISGRKNQSSAKDDFLIERTWKLYKAQRALEIMDPTLEGSYSWEEGIRVIKIGLLCTQAAAALRPSMSRVVWMLTSDGEHLLSPTKPAFIEVESVEEPDLDVHSAAITPSYSVLEPR